nr:MAG TPA: hypothetical protein [Caudoviricetes sp.]
MSFCMTHEKRIVVLTRCRLCCSNDYLYNC